MWNRSLRTRRLLFALLGILCLFGGPIIVDRASAQEAKTTDEIVKALKSRSFRGVALEPGTDNKPPSIDLYINFKYDSAELEPEALLALKSLGQALQSQELKDARIQIVGHTDAKGGDAYNQKLSERRASAVRSLLVGIYDLDPAHLEAVGRGRSDLKDESQPEDGINRRVEIRNVSN